MSKKNNDSAKQKCLAEKQRLKQKKLLLQMEKEIRELQMDIKHSKISNAKINALRALKISLRFGQLIAPFVVTAGITIGGFAALGGTPFYRDRHKQNLEMMKKFDSFGNIIYEQQYDDYAVTKNTISYYGKWTNSKDGFYSRNVEIYSIGNITEETIMKLVNENNISSLQEVLGEPISNKTETKNNLTEEELACDSYLQAFIYSEFEDDYIMVKESIDDNIAITFLWIVMTILCELIPIVWRISGSTFNFGDCVKKIKSKYPHVDTEELARRLEIKRSNYDRLTR